MHVAEDLCRGRDRDQRRLRGDHPPRARRQGQQPRRRRPCIRPRPEVIRANLLTFAALIMVAPAAGSCPSPSSSNSRPPDATATRGDQGHRAAGQSIFAAHTIYIYGGPTLRAPVVVVQLGLVDRPTSEADLRGPGRGYAPAELKVGTPADAKTQRLM